MTRILALIALVLTSSAFAAGSADQVTISDAYVRLAPPGAKVTGAFMTLKNNGEKEVKLVSAASTVAGQTELHNHINENGVMRMRQVKEIVVPAKGETTLKPGSYHVMLIDMKSALKEDDHVVIALGFGDGSSREVHAVVKKPMAEMPVKTMEHSKHNH